MAIIGARRHTRSWANRGVASGIPSLPTKRTSSGLETLNAFDNCRTNTAVPTGRRHAEAQRICRNRIISWSFFVLPWGGGKGGPRRRLLCRHLEYRVLYRKLQGCLPQRGFDRFFPRRRLNAMEHCLALPRWNVRCLTRRYPSLRMVSESQLCVLQYVSKGFRACRRCMHPLVHGGRGGGWK